jgi:hypothetical protein
MNDNAASFWKLLSFGFLIVMVGVILKDANSANTILTGFSNAYTSTLGTLEKAG